MKLSERETKFMAYWEKNRKVQKKFLSQLIFGLPLGAVLASVILLNYFSGWYLRANMNMSQSSLIVLILAAIIIMVFVAIFSRKFQYDQNEQRYKELIIKKEKPEVQDAP